jgi:multidrug efflux pump subunit AcrA (membrane-fusion protein)
MSAASDQALIESKNAGHFSRTTTRTPVLVRHTRAALSGSVTASPNQSWKTLLGFATAALAFVAVVAVYQPWHLLPVSSAATETHEVETSKAVSIARPTPAANSNVVLPATFRPWQTAALHARVNGYLTAWHRDLGATVKAGELLAEIETPELDQELAEGVALAGEAAAAAVQARAERIEAQADLKVAEAQLGRAQAEYELANSHLVRRDKLVQSRAISQEEYDTFRRQLEARAADVAAAESDVARRRTNLDTRAAVIAAREATAKSRQSNVDRLKELQGFKRIIAPFDGTVTSRIAEVGMLVTAGKEPLFVVEDISRIRVQLNVPQTYAMQTAPGVLASIHLPESNVPAVQGEITRIAESVDSTSRTMLAEIELDNATHHFQPGSYAQVTLAARQNSASWTIPTNTVSMRSNGPHVALVNEQSQIEMKRVTLGRDLGDRVVVAAGIRGEERLIVNPSDSLVSGSRVEINRPSETGQNVAQR